MMTPKCPFCHSWLPATPAGFPVYNSLLFRDLPADKAAMMSGIKVVQAWSIWGCNPGDGKGMPTEAAVRNLVKNSCSNGDLVSLDIETWPVDPRYVTPQVFATNVGKFTTVLDWMRDEAAKENKTLRIGIYGVLPIVDWYKPLDPGPGSIKYIAWQAANAKLAVLAAKVDVIFPRSEERRVGKE